MGINADTIQKLYIAYFGRPADVTGLAYWEGQVDGKKITIEGIAQSFSEQVEYAKTYAGKSNVQIVDALYQNLFGHSADLAGLKYWVGQLDNKVVGLGVAALAITNGALGDDAKVVTNKLAAANAFLKEMDTAAEIISYNGDNAFASARGFLSTVNATDASATAAVAAAPAAVLALTTAAGNGATSDTVLTVGQDIKPGTSGNDFFRGVVGAAIGSQDQTTLNSSDIIDGGAGQDQLIVNMTGNYQGGATVKNVETIKLGTDLAAASFDYNVNQGVNEITGVNTIVYDQINAGEALSVNNIVAKTDLTLPEANWVNDSTNGAAGTINVNYRAAATQGTNNQAVGLTNVTAGSLNIGAGIETITVTAAYTAGTAVRDTLVNSTGNTVDISSGVVGGNADTSSLTTVNVVSAATVGFGVAPAANNRVVGSDTVGANAAGLVSVASSVTKIDATKADGGVNMRFTAKANNSDVDVTFLGGSNADYIEFERGSINADGGAGNDTFAFINNLAAGVTNATFGSTDSIKGGAGKDTIQIGLNGVGTYTLNTTEFNNKSGLEVLDVRGLTNDIRISSEIVAGADVGTFEIKTNVIGAGEAASTNVINLTALNQNQGIIVSGGEGSDRIVVNNASLNAATVINAGGNGGVAGRYDTLTILDSAVADQGDLAKVTGIETMLLAETVTGNSTFNVTLTEAFLLANSQGTNAVETSIDDTVFRIGSAASSTGTALNAGDSVTIDISGLLNATRTGLSANLAGRGIDVALGAATVIYTVDGATATAAQVAFVTKADAARADAGVSSAAGAVIVPPVAAVNVSTTAALITANASSFTGGAGTADTLTVTDAGTVTVGSTTTLFENLVLANGANTVTFAQAGINNITGGTGADTVTLTNLAASTSVNLGAGSDALTATGTLTGTLAGGDGADTLTLTGASNIAGATVSGFETLTAGGTLSLTAAQAGNFTTAFNSGANLVTLTTAGSVSITGTGTNFQLANGTNDFTIVTAGADSVTGGTGADTINLGANLTVADTISGGAGTDTLNVTDDLAVTDLNTVTLVEVLNIANTNATAYTTVDTLVAAGSTFTVNANGVGGLTFNGVLEADGGFIFTTTGEALTLTGGLKADVATFGAGADVWNSAGSLFGQTGGIDTLNNFKVAGADTFKTGTAATTLNNLTIATADFTTLGAAIGTAAVAAGATLAANTQAYIITVTAGAAAGTYAFQNIGGTFGAVDATDFIVKIVGAGTIVAADFTV